MQLSGRKVNRQAGIQQRSVYLSEVCKTLSGFNPGGNAKVSQGIKAFASEPWAYE
jgi:hypothetical protein